MPPGSWIPLALVAGAALWAALRVRSRQKPEARDLRRFVVRLRERLAATWPEVVFRGLIPGELAVVLEVGGQETPVPLDDAFRRAQAFPEDFDRIVADLLRDVREIAIDTVGDHPFEDVAPCLLPQVRHRSWLEEKGMFGDSGLVYRTLTDDLVVVYVIDDPQTMVFVCRAHLVAWRRSEAEIHHLALANLRRLPGPDLRHGVRHDGGAVVATGDGYDAARLLLLAADSSADLLVAVPDRDLLWVGDGSELAELMEGTKRLNASAPHPVSHRVYRVAGGQVAAIN